MRTTLGLSDDVPLIGCVGRLCWQKAPEVFVAACRRIHQVRPEAHFVLIGSGPLHEQVDRAVDLAGLRGRLHLIPGLSNAAAAMPEFDVHVLPSRFEGGPYTPMEAMRAGTPVVVTDVAGNADLVSHRVNGLVVPPDDPDRLAAEVLSLLSDPVVYQSLVGAARLSLAEFDVVAHAVADIEIHWSWSCGNPLWKYGWNFGARLANRVARRTFAAFTRGSPSQGWKQRR